MSSSFLRFVALGALVVFATTASRSATAPNTAITSIKIEMKALNGSDENGFAVLTQKSDGVQVEVALGHAPAGIAQPTHIHIGTCGNINKAPEYALVNTVDGKGTSTVAGVNLAELLKGHYAINVHKSGTDLATYVSCGNIVTQ
jgi:hypothetical protein